MLWADVYNAAGARQGAGPVLLKDAAITRNLDGIGTVAFSVPGMDGRAVALLTNEARVRIYTYSGGTIRELGRGVIRNKRFSGTPSNWTLALDGPDELDALTRVTTLLGRKYSNTAPASIASSLVGLVSGWSSSGSGGSNTDARFDGASVWTALTALAEGQGLHIRAGSSAQTVEIGAFGTDSGLRLINPVQVPAAMYDNDDVALIDTINVEMSSDAVATRLYPMGAGIGEALLSLEQSTRNSPYTIGTVTGPDGTTNYYLEDSTATTAYGLIEKFGKFRQVAPLSNSPGDVENAANALYDISSAWLQRYSQRLDVYRVTARKVRQTIRPGDKVRLVYKGVVTRDGVVVTYLDVNQLMWVSSVTERHGLEGGAVDFELITVDRQVQDAAQIILGAMEDIQLDGVTVKQYFNRAPLVYDRLIKGGTGAIHANIPLRLTLATQKLTKCTMLVSSRPFISVTAPGTALAAHRHTVFASSTPTATDNFYWRTGTMYDDISEGSVTGLMAVSEETDSLLIQTSEANPEDFGSLEYGIYEDTNTPDTLSIWVDGTDQTSALGGPWAVGGGNEDFEVDLTDAINAGTLQTTHTISIRAASGQGRLEISVEVFDVISSIRGV